MLFTNDVLTKFRDPACVHPTNSPEEKLGTETVHTGALGLLCVEEGTVAVDLQAPL